MNEKQSFLDSLLFMVSSYFCGGTFLCQLFNIQGRIIANGATAEVEDEHLGRIARTDYDLADRPCQTELKETVTGKVLYRALLKYDKFSNLEQFTEKTGDEIHTSKYAYDRDNRVTEIQYDGAAQKVAYAYDDLGRVTARTAECGNTAGKLTSTYTYVDGAYGTNSTTPLVKKITQNGISFEYTYDTRGNIISEKRGNLTTTYAYDALGQLIRVNDPHENATWVYNYDRGGNITSKVKYAYTTGTLGTAVETIPYAYDDANWKDKLTSYNGTAITYDAIGNPLNDGSWTYEWAVGRQLKKMSKPGKEIEFKYDFNGLRTQKIVTENGVTTTTNYLLHGKLVTHMTVGNDKLHFFYDNSSRPAKVDFNGTVYTYLHNLQGDVVGILDNTGNLVVEYKYDAWGKPLSTTGSLADTLGVRNPFRYRGYVYDEESELYYLGSRFYKACTKRFLNADSLEEISVLTLSMYHYCCNSPVRYTDPNGCLFVFAFEVDVLWPDVVPLDIGVAVPAIPILPGEILVLPVIPTESFREGFTRLERLASKSTKNTDGVADDEHPKKKRSENPPAKRYHFSSKKKAYEAAKRAGHGKEPELHLKKGPPHYHPAVERKQAETPKQITKHDHYYSLYDILYKARHPYDLIV